MYVQKSIFFMMFISCMLFSAADKGPVIATDDPVRLREALVSFYFSEHTNLSTVSFDEIVERGCPPDMYFKAVILPVQDVTKLNAWVRDFAGSPAISRELAYEALDKMLIHSCRTPASLPDVVSILLAQGADPCIGKDSVVQYLFNQLKTVSVYESAEYMQHLNRKFDLVLDVVLADCKRRAHECEQGFMSRMTERLDWRDELRNRLGCFSRDLIKKELVPAYYTVHCAMWTKICEKLGARRPVNPARLSPARTKQGTFEFFATKCFFALDEQQL